jgi:hypothetical protein
VISSLCRITGPKSVWSCVSNPPGPKIVAEWYDQGVRSIDDLGKVVTISNRAQQLCLQHYHDINTPIARAELDQVMGFIHKVLMYETQRTKTVLQADTSRAHCCRQRDNKLTHSHVPWKAPGADTVF